MKKQVLTNAWMQGLLMAAVVAVALPMPDIALADLATTATNAQTNVFNPALKILSYASYTVGGFMGIGGVMKLKAHTENPTNAPMAHGLGRLGAGAAFLALPSVMGLLNSTSSSTLDGTATFKSFNF